jgi:hypothetical protein
MRMSFAVPVAAVTALSAAAVVAPSAHARIDGDEACNGGLYDLITFDGQRWVRCLAGDLDAQWGTLTVPDVTASENEHAMTFTVSRGTNVNTIWFSYTTVDGTAKAGVDYTATSGAVRWINELSKTITVPIADDAVRTGDRSFSLRLGTVGGPTLSLPARDAVATIGDDEPAPGPDPDPDPPAEGTTPDDGDGGALQGDDDAPTATTATTPAPSAPLVAPAPAAPAPPTTPAAPTALTARLAQARTLASVLDDRTRLAVRCSLHCSLTAKLTVPAATARALGLSTRTIGTARGAGTGRILLPIRLSRTAKAALRRHPRTVVATATVRDAQGAPARTVRITLRRPR